MLHDFAYQVIQYKDKSLIFTCIILYAYVMPLDMQAACVYHTNYRTLYVA